MPISDRFRDPRVIALHEGKPFVEVAPAEVFAADWGTVSRDITRQIIVDFFASGQPYTVLEIANLLETARLTVRKRVDRFSDFGLVYHTLNGWKATPRGMATFTTIRERWEQGGTP
jgi:hypothetical protein